MLRLLLFIICLTGFSLSLIAQNIEKGQEIELVYQKEWRAGIKAHSSGYGLCVSKAKVQNRTKKKLWLFELQEIRHLKQSKQTSFDASVYYYGKQNNFYNLNVSYGKQKIWAEKGRKSGVEIGLQYSGGLSLGLLKPYYLRIGRAPDGQTDEKYDPTDETQRFLNTNLIHGASGFLYGLEELSVLPGLVGHIGFTFDWSTHSESIKTLETGLMLNVYPKRVPIMINTDNHFFLANLYVKLLIGRRWIE